MSDIVAILLVDDDEDFLELLVQSFTRRGMLAIGAGTPLDALQAATAQQFDVVVIDRKLRGDDGLQLMVQLKSMNAGLPVIVLSGYCDDSSVVSALDQGAFEYLTKPCGLADLEATVNRALALRRLESTEHSHLQETIVGTPCHAFLLRAPMPAT